MKNLKIIAEVGSVHDGSFGNALKAIEAAANCGADVVKFQTHIAEAETLKNAPNPPYFQEESRFDYFRRTGFSLEQWKRLKAKAADCGAEFLSSPFSLEAVDLLEQLDVPAYKIPSGEVTNIPLLHKSDKLPDCLAKFSSLGFPELPILILHQAPHLQGGFTSLKGFKLRRLITLIPLKLVGCKTSHSIVVNLVSVTSSLYR
ncbi:MAG: hypothetical protein EON58_22610 [Alphaproteobacteria bacterium]|nr:MAG: hypothetical protein EON58_22610 [Alphaproteobacteria bacterium]